MKSDWTPFVLNEFRKPYMIKLMNFLDYENRHKDIYPDSKNILKALRLTPLKEVKVVILGQDPYHGKGQANGLAFSVSKKTPIPPSLRNIFDELSRDLDIPVPNHGNLKSWAEQGVLLLNTTLTVSADSPGSHYGKGWEIFTDSVIQVVAERPGPKVFMLWGSKAKMKSEIIGLSPDNLVLEAAHPSPLSCGGFFGCKHFSITNEFLTSKGISPIDWKIY